MKRSRTWPPLVGAAAGALTLAFGLTARADSDEHARTAGSTLVNVDRDMASVQAAVDKARNDQMSVEERLANGEILYRMKDYARAGLVFSEIMEKYPNTSSYPDALWLRGETYYASHEYLSARRDYRALVEGASSPRFQAYFGRALARLVDVSLRIGDIQGLDEVFSKLGQVPPAQVDAGLNYAKGKAYYAKGDYSTAQSSFQAVPPSSEYGPQSRYFLGLVAMKQVRPAATAAHGATTTTPSAPPNYRPAIDAFAQVTQLSPDTDDHRHVIDLGWMAIGRLFYEMEQYAQAADAYSHVSRESPEFDTMLYELAWTYVRVGDVERAQRALEVLQVADPTSPYVGDGTLLQADLLLRAGSFDKALELYEAVRTQYDPMRAKVETFLDSTNDVGVYYEKLSQQQLDSLEQNDALPPLAIRWAREAEDGPAAFAVIDDVNECRTLIKQSNALIERLTVLTEASNRVRAFPELEAGEERALGLVNSVAHARVEIAKGLDDDEKDPVGAELATIRTQRRALMGDVANTPTSSGEFAARDEQGQRQWNGLSQSLTARNLEIDQLQAIVNGLRRLLKDDAQKGVARDPQAVANFNSELDASERDLKMFRQQAEDLHHQVDFGCAQVGVGDSRYQADATARTQFRELLDKEVALAMQGQGGQKAQLYSQRVQPLLVQARGVRGPARRGVRRARATGAAAIGRSAIRRSTSSAARWISTRSSSTRSTTAPTARTTSSVTSRSATSGWSARSCAASSFAPTSASRSRRGRCARKSARASPISRPSALAKSSCSTRRCARCSTTRTPGRPIRNDEASALAPSRAARRAREPRERTMRHRASKWLFAAGTVGALTFGLTVDAQQSGGKPGNGNAKGGKAPAAAHSAATATSSADAGAPASAASSAAAAPAASSSAAPADASNSPVVPSQSQTITLVSQHKSSPPPPPPTQQQLAAYEALRAETDAFAAGAKDYRDTVTTIITLHYQAKKKEILSGLDSEIGIEKAELKKARETAIKRLEEFIATYSGPRADPVATPDAMYRLAALYEERARSEDATEDVAIGLRPAVALYKRIINEYPSYKQLAGVFYFLAHAYDDSGRTDEEQQVYRSLVCHNHFQYPTPPNPKSPDQDTVLPLPQDHDEEYWGAWRANHRDPGTLRGGGPDTSFVDPYLADCTPIPEPGLLPGETSKYIPESWWQIGEWEFNQLDFGGGVVKDEPAAVYDYDRAASAYQHSMSFKSNKIIYPVALYKYAWTLFKQQRYEAATKEFVHLLLFTDDIQKQTGDPGTDFRNESYLYIAQSLTELDFTGPQPNEPFIQRPDIMDVEPDPVKREIKLHVAIDRLHDPNVIPQDKTWTINIYRAVAGEFRDVQEYNNAIEIYSEMLKRWPLDPTAPDTQNAMAETYDQQLVTLRVGTAEHDAVAAKALEARTALANYIGNTPWTDANKDNPEALANAEKLVKGGLRAAAVAHTNNGIAALNEAANTSDPARQAELLERARAEYKLAVLGWSGFLHQDENAPNAYESRYWLADAREKQIEIELALAKLKKGPPPTPAEVADAKQAAIDVRDSNEDDKFLTAAAVFVVKLSDVDSRPRVPAVPRHERRPGRAGAPRAGSRSAEDGQARVHADPVAGRLEHAGARRLRGPRAGGARRRQQRDQRHDVHRRLVLQLRPLRRLEEGLRADVQGPLREGRVRLPRMAHLDHDEQLRERRRLLARARAGGEGPPLRDHRRRQSQRVAHRRPDAAGSGVREGGGEAEGSAGRAAWPGEGQAVARDGRSLRGGAHRRAEPQGSARRRDERGVRLQTGR